MAQPTLEANLRQLLQECTAGAPMREGALWTNPSLVFRDEYDVNSNVAGVDASAFFRQDANALERLSKNFARNVVTSILEAF